jgi:hypothetical protein
VSLPLNVTEPVVAIDPAVGTNTFTETVIAFPGAMFGLSM